MSDAVTPSDASRVDRVARIEVPARPKPKIVCVDDESRVLESLVANLRRDFHVFTALSGVEGLKTLEELKDVAVVISDMRMPQMDGSTFLRKVCDRWPLTTRMLLTGDPGRDAAALAINEGQIFRFLTKPCSPTQLRASIDAAVRHHDLLATERTLLHVTLLGSIRALVEVLAMTNPVAFGRAGRIKRLCIAVAAGLGKEGVWELEAAAMFSQLGYLSLPVELVEKLYYGEKLTPEEAALAKSVPQVAARLLGHIPRLESVLSIMDLAQRPAAELLTLPYPLGTGAAVLASVLAYDELTSQGISPEDAVATLRLRKGQHSDAVLEQIASAVGTRTRSLEARKVRLRDVREGMTFMNDVHTPLGMLLVPRGFEVTESFLVRMRNFGPGILAEEVLVIDRPQTSRSSAH
jgi:CheY-like chemotaxis protein